MISRNPMHLHSNTTRAKCAGVTIAYRSKYSLGQPILFETD